MATRVFASGRSRGMSALLALLALRLTIAAIPAAPTIPAPAPAFGAFALVRRRGAGLLARDGRQVGIDGTGFALRPLLAALALALRLAPALSLTLITPLAAALTVARLIAFAARLLLL